MGTGYRHIAVLLVALLPVSVAAQKIYESKDEDGNPVFSDTPSQGAERVELQKPNVADSVDIPPSSPAPPRTPPEPGEAPSQLEGDRLLVNDPDRDWRDPGRPSPGRPGIGPGDPDKPRPEPHNPVRNEGPGNNGGPGARPGQGGGIGGGGGGRR